MTVPLLNTQALPELLEVMTNLHQDGFLLLRLGGKIEYATSNLTQLLQWQEPILPGLNLAKIVGDDLCQNLLKPNNQKQLTVEHKITPPGKLPFNVRFSLHPYKDNTTRTKRFLVAVTPLNRQNEHERFSSGKLAASIAHEIRNPLAAILTTAETMIEDIETHDEHREYLERIIIEINRVNLFLVKFLALARPQKPQFTLSSLTEIIDHVIHLENKEIERYNIQFIKEYEPDLPKMLLDPNQMQQVFLNLILNAIQAMPFGGTLQVKIKSSKNDKQKPELIKVEITDNGHGIAPKDLQQIFVPFFSTKPKGVGLGLSLSHQILQDHQGDFWVESQPEIGTTFTVALPMQQTNLDI